jgi:acyl-CoA thioester hydrolase
MTSENPDPPTMGRFDGTEHRFAIRVYFEDTDLSGVVYHANYLRFMERARSDMLDCVGLDQRAAFEEGEGAYAVRGINIRYRAPARLGDALVVVTRVIRIRAASVDIHQRVMRWEGISAATMLAEADVEAAFVAPSGRARRQPAAWVEAFLPLVWKGN